MESFIPSLVTMNAKDISKCIGASYLLEFDSSLYIRINHILIIVHNATILLTNWTDASSHLLFASFLTFSIMDQENSKSLIDFYLVTKNNL